jgi:hypothetical protein
MKPVNSMFKMIELSAETIKERIKTKTKYWQKTRMENKKICHLIKKENIKNEKHNPYKK